MYLRPYADDHAVWPLGVEHGVQIGVRATAKASGIPFGLFEFEITGADDRASDGTDVG